MSADRSDAGLIDILDRVLDKGIVIDAHVRVALAGVEIVAVEARVVVASIQTYLRHAETLSYTSLAARPASAVGAPEAVLPPDAVPPLIAEPATPEGPTHEAPGTFGDPPADVIPIPPPETEP